MAYHAVEANAIGNLTVLNAANCTVNAVHAIMGAASGFVQFFDAAATSEVTLGTTVARYVLQAGTSSVAEGLVGAEAQFVRGIVVACTSTPINSSTVSASVRAWIG